MIPSLKLHNCSCFLFVFSDTRRLEVCGYGSRSIATLRVLPCHNGWHHWHPDGCPTHLWICGSRQDHRHLQRKIILIDTYILILWCSECSSVKRLCQWMLLLYCCYSNPTSRYHSVRIYPMSVQMWLENRTTAFSCTILQIVFVNGERVFWFPIN